MSDADPVSGVDPARDVDPVTSILRREKRFPREAYEFVEEALRLVYARTGRRGHITARDLLDSFRRHARSQFGPMTRAVLAEWNVKATDDVGRIVFLLVEAGSLGKTDDDDENDFKSVFDFAAAFPGVPEATVLPRESEDDE